MRSKKIELVEVLPHVRAPRNEVNAHARKMAQESEALKHPDQEDPKETDEWNIANRIHRNVEDVFEK